MKTLIIDRVTFTGADDTTNPEDLAAIASGRPWLEFAVLLSLTQQGNDRYPSQAWRQKFAQSSLSRAQRALHLCGRIVLQFFDGSIAAEHIAEIEAVRRVQLNFSAVQLPLGDLDQLQDRLMSWCERIPDIEFILQYNHDNAELPARLNREELQSRISFLADASGGRGIAPLKWPAPIAGFRTDYAGGIGPGRIAEVLRTLAEVTPRAGLDMESSLRTDGRFELTKVRQVIEELERQPVVEYGPYIPTLVKLLEAGEFD